MNTENVKARWFWAAISGAVALLVLLVLLVPRKQDNFTSNEGPSTVPVSDDPSAGTVSANRVYKRADAQSRTAVDIVAQKVSQFAESRRQIAYAMARHFNVDVPPGVERFFDVAASGNWDELEAVFNELMAQQRSDPRPRNLEALWPAILETFGVAEQAHLWPAQKLLDYGDSILGALRPGMVYVGGTDPGRFIPTLMNETQGGEHHMVVTQNALADGTYLKYLGFLYGDRCATLTEEDSTRAFSDYMNDAQRRYRHDQQFPNEPRQIRPGEDIQMNEGKVQVSGQIAVMAINERLIRTLMEKNPDLSFAIEQSFPFQSMYGTTAPLGPIMELGVRDAQSTLTPERASQSVDYWRTTAQEFVSNPDVANSPDVRKTFGKMAAEQAALLLHHQHPAQAEEAYRLATQIGPESPEAVFGYVNLLVQQKRFTDAMPVLEAAMRMGTPNRAQFQSLAQELNRMAQQ